MVFQESISKAIIKTYNRQKVKSNFQKWGGVDTQYGTVGPIFVNIVNETQKNWCHNFFLQGDAEVGSNDPWNIPFWATGSWNRNLPESGRKNKIIIENTLFSWKMSWILPDFGLWTAKKRAKKWNISKIPNKVWKTP